MVALSWYDTRYDAENDRVVTETATSIDGGQTYSTNVYANDSETATDTITANTVNLSPIPDNLANAAGASDGTAGFGVHQGLAVYDGHLYPIWTSNENGGAAGNEPMGIRTNVGTFYSGPAVASVTQGPIGGPNDDLNTQTAADGTPELTEFEVTFTGPVDPASFTPSDVRVYYRDTTTNNTTGGYIPISSVTPLNANWFGATEFLVTVPAERRRHLQRDGARHQRQQQHPEHPVGRHRHRRPGQLRGANNIDQTVFPDGTVDSTINVPVGAFAANQVV